MIRRQWVSVCVMATAAILLAQPAKCQKSEPVSRAELRELLLRITDLLDRNGENTEAANSVRQRLNSLDAQAFERLYSFSNNWKKLRIAVALMSTPSNRKPKLDGFAAVADVGLQAASTAGLPADRFDPAYPTGSNYATFRATLPGLGAMTDTAGSAPGLDDERCDANFEAGVAIAAATFAFANIIAEVVCEALPELADIPCWVAQGVLQVAAEANNTVAAQCAIVDGAVDATEIEAAYENTVAIYKNLDAHHLALKSHDADIKTLVNTVSTSLTAALNKHDVDIKVAVAAAVTTVVNALSKHDTDMKTLIAAVKAVVDMNTQQLKTGRALDTQIIRLLLTPEGNRQVNPAVFTCTGDNCPVVLNCPGNECSFPVK